MPYETLAYTVDRKVAEIRLDRPDALNTMTLPFWQELVDVFQEIDQDSSVRAVVICSTGKHFTAGLDLSLFGDIAQQGQDDDAGRARHQLRRMVKEMQQSFAVIDRCRVPVLAAIHGGCIGGGVDLISACDMRYATADAFVCIQEINIGIVADVGTLQRLPHLIPAGWMRELAYTGRRLAATKAKEIGLFNEVYPDHEAMLAAVRATAREIAEKSPLAIAGTKEMLNYARDHSVADALDYVSVWQAGMLLSDDLIAVARASQAKTKPDFEDLPPPKNLVRLPG